VSSVSPVAGAEISASQGTFSRPPGKIPCVWDTFSWEQAVTDDGDVIEELLPSLEKRRNISDRWGGQCPEKGDPFFLEGSIDYPARWSGRRLDGGGDREWEEERRVIRTQRKGEGD
jgi:hypothetical protein